MVIFLTILFIITVIGSLIIQLMMKRALSDKGFDVSLMVHVDDLKNYRRLIREEKDEDEKKFYKKLLLFQILSIIAIFFEIGLIIFFKYN